ncbi:MAG: L-seryl-tRNA(Sec) selenium transferase [Calditrichaceae bacterium]
MSNTGKIELQKIPSVSWFLEKLSESFPGVDHLYLKRIIQAHLDEIRSRPKQYKISQKSRENLRDEIIIAMTSEIKALLRGSLAPVINATGVVLHTGLGRAPLNPELLKNLHQIGRYTNLEIQLENGRRGQRNDHLSRLLSILTGAEDGFAVNNNAAAVMLMLNTVGNRKEVILSRGEMIEIGGAFRMPEVIKMSGCKLHEVGTTNKTHLDDYKEAINERTAAILICHPSNYEVKGFSQKPELKEIVDLGKKHNIPVIYDLGSGSLVDTIKFGSDSEPVVSEIIATDIDIVSFSGDKLLGGPQAGIIVGKRYWIQKCAKNHLLRALRLDKIMISLLQKTLIQYLEGDSVLNKLDALQSLTSEAEDLKIRCDRFTAELPEAVKKIIQIIPSSGKVGSGAYPLMPLPSYVMQIKSKLLRPEKLAKKLRTRAVPVFVRLEDDAVLIDLRTVSSAEETELKSALTDLIPPDKE